MNNNLTELVFVLDRSGSMDELTSETAGGFNSLIRKQKAETNGEVYVTTAIFDDDYELLHDHINISDIPVMQEEDIYARGCTALLDAIGRTIDSVGKRLAETPEEDRPANILFVITTDGYENASTDYSKSKVKRMITRQRTKYNWKFMFLGADIDAVGEASSLGIRKDMAARSSKSGRGINAQFSAASDIAAYLNQHGFVEENDEEFLASNFKAMDRVNNS